MSEELIHHGRAGLNDRPNLMPIHDLGDAGTAVADQLRDHLDGHACIRKRDTNECRSSRGVQSFGSRPGTSASARRRSRRTFAGSISLPTAVANTSPHPSTKARRPADLQPVAHAGPGARRCTDQVTQASALSVASWYHPSHAPNATPRCTGEPAVLPSSGPQGAHASSATPAVPQSAHRSTARRRYRGVVDHRGLDQHIVGLLRRSAFEGRPRCPVGSSVSSTTFRQLVPRHGPLYGSVQT